MSQIDKIAYLPLLVWFIILLFILYFFMFSYFLAIFLTLLKVRISYFKKLKNMNVITFTSLLSLILKNLVYHINFNDTNRQILIKLVNKKI
jgi:hypothetical protein